MGIFKLATKVHGAYGVADFPAYELVLVKRRAGSLFAPLIVGRLWDALVSEGQNYS